MTLDLPSRKPRPRRVAGTLRAARPLVLPALVALVSGCGAEPAEEPRADVAPAPAPPSTRAAADGSTLEVELVRGGDFDRPVFREAEARLGTGVAWWRAATPPPLTAQVDPEQAGIDSDDGRVLRLPPGARVEQILAVDAESFARGVLRVHSDRPLDLRLTDVHGTELARRTDDRRFELDLSAADARLEPPVTLSLAAPGSETVTVDRVSLRVPLPSPSPAELRAAIVERIAWTIELVREHRTDQVGPRSSTLMTADIDVVTGRELGHQLGWVSAYSELLLGAWTHAPRADWEELLVTHVREVLELCLHPETGMPVFWDPDADVQREDVPVEIARAFRYLLDVAERGPESVRGAAREAVVRIGDTVLERGRLASGELLVKYLPATGEGTTLVPRLRALDLVPCMARLTALTGDERYARAAGVALDEFEFLHRWAGSWDEIDPGFDDQLGNWGASFATQLETGTGTDAAERLFRQGLEFYAEPWELALAHGGQIAADQVRTWRVLARAVALDPGYEEWVDRLLADAVHGHLVGQFSAQGIWVDNTHQLWRPRGALETGDLPGVPGNLLEGLGICAEAGLGLPEEELRAWFALVMDTTYDHFARPYGCLPAPIEARGANPSGAEVRLAYALLEMLGTLPED